jgi:hypothetical protein
MSNYPFTLRWDSNPINENKKRFQQVARKEITIW